MQATAASGTAAPHAGTQVSATSRRAWSRVQSARVGRAPEGTVGGRRCADVDDRRAERERHGIGGLRRAVDLDRELREIFVVERPGDRVEVGLAEGSKRSPASAVATHWLRRPRLEELQSTGPVWRDGQPDGLGDVRALDEASAGIEPRLQPIEAEAIARLTSPSSASNTTKLVRWTAFAFGGGRSGAAGMTTFTAGPGSS